MAWQWVVKGKELDWDGTRYLVVDLGSDGNCLFHSLAFVFRLAGENALSSAACREAATAQLIDWVGALPDWFDDQYYEEPDAERISNLVSGDWGDLTCMLGILWRLHPGYFISVLNISHDEDLAEETYTVDLQAAGIDGTNEVCILYLGNNHYVALSPVDREEDIATVTSTLVDLAKKEQPKIDISCKLSTTSGLSRKINTVSKDSLAQLEIHQINVGVGDATLFLFQDAKGACVQSILVDCGRDPQYVTSYFNHLEELGRFRKVDIFVATHYDNDHIGAAAKVLSDNKYVSGSLRLVDQGEPFFPARDYDTYKKTFGEANQNARETPDLEVPLYADKTEDVEFRIVAMNGMVAGLKKGKYNPVVEAFADQFIPKELLNGTATVQDWVKHDWSPGMIIPEDPNDTSLAIYLRYGEFRYLGAGDLNGDAERAVAAHVQALYLGDGHACVCKLNHHGAHESSHPEVIWALRPRVALVSCGVPNTNGHPSPLTLDRMQQLSAKYPAQTLITADLSPLCPGHLLPWARPGQFKSSLDAQGSIVVLVPHSLAHAKLHGFVTVTGANSTPQLHQCGDRDGSGKNPIADTLSKPQRSEKQKKESQQRKLKRKQLEQDDRQQEINTMIDELRRRMGKAIDDFFGLDTTSAKAWKLTLEGELANLAGRLYRNDQSARDQRVSTVVKNFAKTLPDFGTTEKMVNYLGNQK